MRLWLSFSFYPLVFLLAGLQALGACTPQGDPAIAHGGFEDSFDRMQLGSLWKNTGGPWDIRNGELHVQGAHNRPLWLRRKLPREVRVEFDARSESSEGDIKVEVFGDGVSKAELNSYVATSYVVIFGGWGNSKNVLARLDEHGSDRVVGSTKRVVPGQTYAVRIERRASKVQVTVDGQVLLEMDDPDPLVGRGHDHFGFNNWESELFFDNLRITPL
ncbi:MAG: family 16 glycoside hydrolase [Myxococcota bacterium]